MNQRRAMNRERVVHLGRDVLVRSLPQDAYEVLRRTAVEAGCSFASVVATALLDQPETLSARVRAFQERRHGCPPR